MILFDLDGTIANVDRRRQAADEAQANSVRDDRSAWWAAWQDPDNIKRLDYPNELVVSVLRDWRERGKHIVIVSARNDKNRAVSRPALAMQSTARAVSLVNPTRKPVCNVSISLVASGYSSRARMLRMAWVAM